jgi:hypothetical protein
VEAGAEKRHRCCRSCGAAVEPHWRFCPHCEEPLRDPGSPLGSADGGVHRGNPALRLILDLLTLPGSIGLFVALLCSVIALLRNSDPLPLFLILGVLLDLVLVSSVIVVLRGPCPGESTAERIALCTLSLAGVLVTGAFLLGLAEYVYRFLLCSG